jgi:stage III sporulation protein AB
VIKILLGIAIVMFTGFCGFVFSKKYRLRKKFFAQLWEFNERFLSEITYFRRPLTEFVGKYAYEGEFGVVLNNYFQGLKEESEQNAELDFSDCSFLKTDEKSVLYDYFKSLGRGDSNAQKTYFSSAKEMLAKWKNQTETESKKYGDLYIKLGFLCGLLILILIV